MEDAGTPCLCAGRRPYPPFYRTRYGTPMERYGATVSSVNRDRTLYRTPLESVLIGKISKIASFACSDSQNKSDCANP
jgi:hypothetical protein